MSGGADQPSKCELILYQTQDGTVREVLYEVETFWLNPKRLTELSGVDVRTVRELANIFDRGDLDSGSTIRKIWRVQFEESREFRRIEKKKRPNSEGKDA